MAWLRGLLISIAVLCLLALVGFGAYNIAYSAGETAGYDGGYAAGELTGYTAGEEIGYSTGVDAGYSEGYEAGVAIGIGHGYNFKDPTYQEALAFLEQDETDENEYAEDSYVCVHFSAEVCNNAEDAGLRCAYVDIRYPDQQGHAIVGFDTIDRGLVYFEPQTDEIVNLVLGENYYQCVVPKPGYYYAKPSYDDTIESIIIIW